MNREQIFTYLLIYSWALAGAACAHAIRWSKNRCPAFIALLVAILLPLLGARIFSGEYVYWSWFNRLSRGHLPVVATAIASCVPWLVLSILPDSTSLSKSERTLCSRTLVLALFLGSLLVTVIAMGSLMLAAPPVDNSAPAQSASDDAAYVTHPLYAIEQIAQFDYFPICITVSDSGRIFAAATHSRIDGHEWGDLLEVIPQPSGKAKIEIAASSQALVRVYGIVAKGDDLYVSRSGRMTTAKKGVIEQQPAGFVTKISDVDNDGKFDYFDDVISGLPGLLGQHQNNGLLFLDDGSLLICSGNQGDRVVPKHQWEGCLLRSSSDFQEVQPFAEGFRNPFSITAGPDGEIFVIDQDWEIAGDELNHVRLGRHYGHPFVVGMESGEGFTAPLCVGEPGSNLVAVAYPNWPEMKNTLLVTDLYLNKILAIQLNRHGETFTVVKTEEFARVPAPVDICVAPDGSVYITSLQNKLFRISYREKP